MTKRNFTKKLSNEAYAQLKAMSDEERSAHWKKVMTAEYEASLPVYDPETGISNDEWFEVLEGAEGRGLGPSLIYWQPRSEKFHNVPEDSGTQIIFEAETKFDDFDVLFQHWVWDGIEADSIIFVASDVAHLSDNELLKEVEESAINTVKSKMTIKRNTHGFTFVNLNFVTS